MGSVSAGASGAVGGSKTKGKSSQKDFEKMTPEQQAEYLRLRQGATDWLDKGGAQQNTEDFNTMRDALGAQQGQFMDQLTGEQGTADLERILDMQRDASADNLNSTLASLGQTGVANRNSKSSKMGIAQGMAAQDSQRQLQNQQTQTGYDWQDRQTANREQALRGLGQVTEQYGQLSELQRSDSENDLYNLEKYKEMITGDMGGTTDSTSDKTWQERNKNWNVKHFVEGSYSDERLKKNVKNTGKKIKVNKTGAEIPEKEWEYNKEAKEEFGQPEGKFTGVMAQDLEKEDPSAVSEGTSKKDKKKKRKSVDYSKLTKAFDDI